MKLGIEVECWVVDETGRLCDGRDLTTTHDRIEPEFVGPLVEIKTEPHRNEAGLRADLQETFRFAIEAAESRGKRLVPLGTPLTDATRPATGGRGETMETVYGDGIVSAKNCAGTHIHFEKGNVRRQLNLLTALDPALALLSSSPYYLGKRGMTCSRAHAYRHECGEAFHEFCGLWEYTDSVGDWKRRVEAAYDEFVALAAVAGVPADRVHEQFCPENTVLNPVRLRDEQPTVEWRAPDAALPSQVVRLASDVADLVGQTDRKPLETGAAGVHADRFTVPEFETLEAVSREAVRWGLDSGRVRTYLTALGFDLGAYRPIAHRLRGPGTIQPADAREIRLEYADRLASDVATMTDSNSPDPGGRQNAPSLHG